MEVRAKWRCLVVELPSGGVQTSSGRSWSGGAGEGRLDAAGFFCICNIKFSIPNL